MRPATLAQAFERIAAGVPLEKALPEFLDEFYLAPSADTRRNLRRLTNVAKPDIVVLPRGGIIALSAGGCAAV